MKKTLLFTIALFISVIGYSQTFTWNNITYTVTSVPNNTVGVSGYNMNGGSVVTIPASVTNNSVTYSVTSITDFALGNKPITSVTIPDTFTLIGKSAFNNCDLTSVNIPSSVITIKESAFGNNDLNSIVLSDGLTTIGNYAFSSNKLTNINIPASVTSIGNGAFAANPNLANVYSNSATPAAVVNDTSNNDSFGSNKSSVNLFIPAGTMDVYITNPSASADWTGFNTVYQFFVNNYITYQLTATNTVKTIDYNMDGGASVTVPNTVINASVTYAVTAIDNNSFYNNNLTTATIADGVTTIGKNAFKNNNITNIVIPNSVTDIDENAFENNQLASVTLSTTLTEIKPYVFKNNMLISLTIPSNVGIIQKEAFLNNQLTSLTIPSNTYVIYQRAFKNNQLTSLTLENGITTIYHEGFRNNQLTSITIPGSVSNIGNATFVDNPLTSITSVKTTAPNINTHATWDSFSGDRSGINLIIPSGSMASYVTGANANWTGFNSVTEDAALSISDVILHNKVKIFSTLNKLKVEYSNDIKLQNYTIYNMSGVEVLSGKKKEISTDFLSGGIYIIKLDFDKGSLTKKFLK